MKNTYAAPAVTDRGDVVRTTLTGKPIITWGELLLVGGAAFGNNLSFGL